MSGKIDEWEQWWNMKDTEPEWLGRRGTFHVDCGECGADAHILGHNRFKEHHEEPQVCPYCGSGEALLIPEYKR